MHITLSKLTCTGCTACASACPKNAICMEADEKGFLYPKIDPDRCIDCGICKNVCPIIPENIDSQLNHGEQHCYALKHSIDSIRDKSSSGGAFTALSDIVLSEKGVVYGAAYDNDLNVLHIRTDNGSDRNRLRDSKYVQSNLHNIFHVVKEDLINGKRVLFTGTPCQIAGLKSYIRKDYDNLLTCEIFCHSVPSPLIFREHLKMLENKHKSKPIMYESRNKRYGWTRHDAISFANGRIADKSMLSQMYYKLFNMQIIARPSCAQCPFSKRERAADVSIGDFWGYKDAKILFADNGGLSVLLANTPKGVDFVKKLSNVQICELTSEEAFNRNHKKPIVPNVHTEEFWDDYVKRGYLYVIRKYADYTIKGKLIFRMKQAAKNIRNHVNKKTIQKSEQNK